MKFKLLPMTYFQQLTSGYYENFALTTIINKNSVLHSQEILFFVAGCRGTRTGGGAHIDIR